MAEIPTKTGNRAVFISYARDDADAAGRIAEALRSEGLEVWFDQNELRGGDERDQKIRKQIDACALFVPLISRHTQDRSKEYVRLEWKLAVDQTELMASGVTFIAPVAIDGISESDALVPPEFLKVPWTRLPDAQPTPEFVTQVKTISSQRRKPILKEGRPAIAKKDLPPLNAAAVAAAAAAAAAQQEAAARQRGVPRWVWVAVAVVLLLGVIAAVIKTLAVSK